MKEKSVVKGLVLRSTDTKEADQVLTVLTAPMGTLSVVAKGFRGRRSRGAAAAQVSSEDMASLKKDLTAFSLSYDDDRFSQVEDTKYSLDAAMMEYVSFNAMEGLADAMAEAGINFHQIRASKAGVVS